MYETLIELFRNRPQLAAELLTDQFGVRLPPYQSARLGCGDLPEVKPTEYRADAVVNVVLAALPAVARSHLEALMSSSGLWEYQSEFVRKYIYQGRAEALLAVLAARGVDVPDEARERITGCTDADQLDTWIRRAVTADKVTDLFD